MLELCLKIIGTVFPNTSTAYLPIVKIEFKYKNC